MAVGSEAPLALLDAPLFNDSRPRMSHKIGIEFVYQFYNFRFYPRSQLVKSNYALSISLNWPKLVDEGVKNVPR